MKTKSASSKTAYVTTVQEIEQAIAKLSRQEFFDLARWFDEERNRKWDEQIETDSKSGALDSLLREVEDDIAKGKTRPTDDLCTRLSKPLRC